MICSQNFKCNDVHTPVIDLPGCDELRKEKAARKKEGSWLRIPRFRLPHQEPFTRDRNEHREPQ